MKVHPLRYGLQLGRHSLHHDGVREAVKRTGYHFYWASRRGMNNYRGNGKNRGEPVYDSEWDALVLLDGARPDALEAVAEEYSFLDGEVETRYSLGSTSDEWLENNFVAGDHGVEKANTLMVSGNPFAADSNEEERGVLNHDDFQHVERAWEYARNHELDAVRPEPITGAAIQKMRELEPGRTVVHYMQPHFPFLTRPDIGVGLSTGEIDFQKDAWDELLVGNYTEAEIREAYLDNLRLVLDEVEILRENMDAPRTIISADHGNAFGNWNRREQGFYGHERGVDVEAMREVPWVEIEAEDRRTYESGTDYSDRMRAQSVDELLKCLGYN